MFSVEYVLRCNLSSVAGRFVRGVLNQSPDHTGRDLALYGHRVSASEIYHERSAFTDWSRPVRHSWGSPLAGWRRSLTRHSASTTVRRMAEISWKKVFRVSPRSQSSPGGGTQKSPTCFRPENHVSFQTGAADRSARWWRRTQRNCKSKTGVPRAASRSPPRSLTCLQVSQQKLQRNVVQLQTSQSKKCRGEALSKKKYLEAKICQTR